MDEGKSHPAASPSKDEAVSEELHSDLELDEAVAVDSQYLPIDLESSDEVLPVADSNSRYDQDGRPSGSKDLVTLDPLQRYMA